MEEDSSILEQAQAVEHTLTLTRKKPHREELQALEEEDVLEGESEQIVASVSHKTIPQESPSHKGASHKHD